MAKTKALNVTEARRALPRLLHRIAEGGGPIAIGARGKGQAVLVKLEDYDALRAQRPTARGWEALKLSILGPAEDLERDLATTRAELAAHLDRRAAKLPALARTRERA